MELLKSKMDVDILHVPFNGGPAALMDVVAGRVDMMMFPQNMVQPHVNEGTLKALAVTSADRTRTWPELPSIAETGVAGFELIAWTGIVAPKGTPEPIIARLNEKIVAILRQPERQQRFVARGATPHGTTAEELRLFIDGQLASWKTIVAASGARVE